MLPAPPPCAKIPSTALNPVPLARGTIRLTGNGGVLEELGGMEVVLPCLTLAERAVSFLKLASLHSTSARECFFRARQELIR